MTRTRISTIDGKTFCGIQFLLTILGVCSNALRPHRSERILNTENTILWMKDFDEDNADDLEIIKDFPESFPMDKRLRNFHRLVRAMKATERAQQNHGVRSAKSTTFDPDLSFEVPFKRVARKHRKRKRRPPKYDRRKYRQERRGRREKRALTISPFIINTDDRNLERQYEDFVAACQRNNIAYKYTDKGKPEENVYDALSKIMELNFPKNCINITGVGLDAIECLLIDIKNGEINSQQLTDKILTISFVWIGIYLTIATILWCTKGWCCCCFRCSICFPNKTIRNIKKYLKENPPGFHHDSKGRVERHCASAKEKELYEILTKSVEQY